MRKKKYSIEEFKDIVENEGLEYTICDYLSPEDIDDDELCYLAAHARKYLYKIKDRLEQED